MTRNKFCFDNANKDWSLGRVQSLNYIAMTICANKENAIFY